MGCARVRHPRGSARGERRGGSSHPGTCDTSLASVSAHPRATSTRGPDATIPGRHSGRGRALSRNPARAHQARSRRGGARVARTPRPIAPAMATRGARRARRRGGRRMRRRGWRRRRERRRAVVGWVHVLGAVRGGGRVRRRPAKPRRNARVRFGAVRTRAEDLPGTPRRVVGRRRLDRRSTAARLLRRYHWTCARR